MKLFGWCIWHKWVRRTVERERYGTMTTYDCSEPSCNRVKSEFTIS